MQLLIQAAKKTQNFITVPTFQIWLMTLLALITGELSMFKIAKCIRLQLLLLLRLTILFVAMRYNKCIATTSLLLLLGFALKSWSYHAIGCLEIIYNRILHAHFFDIISQFTNKWQFNLWVLHRRLFLKFLPLSFWRLLKWNWVWEPSLLFHNLEAQLEILNHYFLIL